MYECEGVCVLQKQNRDLKAKKSMQRTNSQTSTKPLVR